MECNCISPIVKCFLVPGFFIICINSLAALVYCSVVDKPVMMRCCGKNSTISEFLYTLLFGVYHLYHLYCSAYGTMLYPGIPWISQFFRCCDFS